MVAEPPTNVLSFVFLVCSCSFSSVVDPDPYGSALIWLSWIRIRVGNADPDPDPEAGKLTKINKFQPLKACVGGWYRMFDDPLPTTT